jgi:hypothetical protein
VKDGKAVGNFKYFYDYGRDAEKPRPRKPDRDWNIRIPVARYRKPDRVKSRNGFHELVPLKQGLKCRNNRLHHFAVHGRTLQAGSTKTRIET